MTVVTSMPSLQQQQSSLEQVPNTTRRPIWKDKKKDLSSDIGRIKLSDPSETCVEHQPIKTLSRNETRNYLSNKKSVLSLRSRYVRNDSNYSATSNFSNKESFRTFKVSTDVLDQNSDHTFYDEDDDDGMTYNYLRANSTTTAATRKSNSKGQKVQPDLWERVKMNTVGIVGGIVQHRDTNSLTTTDDDDAEMAPVLDDEPCTTTINILQTDMTSFNKFDWFKYYDTSGLNIHSYIRQRHVIGSDLPGRRRNGGGTLNQLQLFQQQRRRRYLHHPVIELSV